MSNSAIETVDRLELSLTPEPWAFAVERRAEIDAHFAKLRQQKSALWNGRALMLHEHRVSGGVFHGAFLETDFASLQAWRDWGHPEAGILNCFAAGAVMSADGAYLLGVMAPHTANAGLIYFPCGTPDPGDVVQDRVDFDHSVRRELVEETGLTADDLAAEPGWTVVRDGPRLALIRLMRTPHDAETLRARVLAHLAREREPELSGIRLVRNAADLDAAMPGFVSAFLKDRWAVGLPSAGGRRGLSP